LFFGNMLIAVTGHKQRSNKAFDGFKETVLADTSLLRKNH